MLADHKPGETVKLQIYRGNRQRTLDVTLGRQPSVAGLAQDACSSWSTPYARSSASAAA